MDDANVWMWLMKTNQGDFFITVVGKWTQEEAAKKVRMVFETIKLDIVGMIPRKRSTGPDDNQGTLSEQLEPKDGPGYCFFAGKKFWDICGRGVEYEAQLILLKEQLKKECSGQPKSTGGVEDAY